MRLALLMAVTLLVATTGIPSEAQSIRKDYREMTPAEKEAFVDALNALWSNGTISEIEQLHVDLGMSIHRTQYFLPWHRMYLQDFEQALREIDPSITVPYWDWTVDRSTTPAWNASDFLGPFNQAWSLGRQLGATGNLPTATVMQRTLENQSFSTGGATGNGFGGCATIPCAGDLEIRHNGAHNWVGGIMTGMAAPRDPIFFLHHAYIDLVWAAWSGTSTFTVTSMPNYPEVDPHSIVDPRSLKVWYAKGGTVTLDRYTATGNEVYRYTGQIVAANQFVVPVGTSAVFDSDTGITLNPGFRAVEGSSFTARVSAAGGSPLLATAASPGEMQPRSQEVLESATGREASVAEAGSAVHAHGVAEAMSDLPQENRLGPNYPNPFNQSTIIEYALKEEGPVSISIFNMLGQEVATLVDDHRTAGRHSVEWSVNDGRSPIATGVYLCRMIAGDYSKVISLVVIR